MKIDKISNYPDLVKYRRKNIIVPIVFFIIYLIVILSFYLYCYLTGQYENHWVFYLIAIIILLVPIFVLKPFSFLFDKNYIGRIVDIKYKEVMSQTSSTGASSKVLFTKDKLEIRIKTINNKVTDYEISNDYLDDSGVMQGIYRGRGPTTTHIKSHLIDYYKVGDEIEHFSGFYYNKKLNLNPNEKNICIVCGALNLPKDDLCANCGHSIVK